MSLLTYFRIPNTTGTKNIRVESRVLKHSALAQVGGSSIPIKLKFISYARAKRNVRSLSMVLKKTVQSSIRERERDWGQKFDTFISFCKNKLVKRSFRNFGNFWLQPISDFFFLSRRFFQMDTKIEQKQLET